MTKAASWLLSLGVLLFVAVLVSHDFSAIMGTLAHAGWGLLVVAAFHLLPLAIDAWAICVLFEPDASAHPLRDSVAARWVGESANSLMPAGQIGGPVLMARFLGQRGIPKDQAAAAITVSTTMQTFGQIAFALLGIVALRTAALVASAFLGVQVGGFYLIQRRGLFSKVMWAVRRFAGKRDWSSWTTQAEAIDAAVQEIYRRNGPVSASFILSLVGWVVGTGEVYLIAVFLGTPVDWPVAFVLESLGQAIRGAGFAIPGALGVQEGGYLLLAPLAGLSPDAAVALSLAKRTRELLLGLPGLLYLRLGNGQTAAADGGTP
jgi:putative membrane protein